MNTNGFSPPQNTDAELAVLSSILANPPVIDLVTPILTQEDFYSKKNSLVYQGLMELSNNSQPIDPLILSEHLRRKGLLESAGGEERIKLILCSVTSTVNVAHYAELVRHASRQRGLIKVGGLIANLGFEGEKDSDEMVALAEAALSTLYSTDKDESDSAGDLADLIVSRIENDVPLDNVTPTGYGALDTKIGGLVGGQVAIVAARPSVGKSAFACNLALKAATTGTHVHIVTLEMTPEELTARLLASLSRVPLNAIRWRQASPQETSKLREAANVLKVCPITISRLPSMNPTQIKATARRLRRQEKLDLLIIDYLQLIEPNERRENRQVEVAAISRSIKALALELQIPILALSQLSRDVESREDKRPTLRDLRESGAIEQDADLVLMLYRESMYSDVNPQDAANTEFIIAKNRNGVANETAHLLFRSDIATFLEPKGVI